MRADPIEAYHVTEAGNVPTIQREGLVPRVGPRASRLGEPVPAIYLFADRVSAEDAVANWLGDAFDDDVDIVLLQVRVAEDLAQRPDLAMGGELMVTDPILPGAIWVLGLA